MQASFSKLLSNKKITNVKALADNKLWICTYEGLIQYDPLQAEAIQLYPQHSFSDGILDKENNYWFSTLQTGILRLPNTQFLVWDSNHPTIKNDKLTKIAADGQNIYFSSVNGHLGKINTHTNHLTSYQTGVSADIQSLNYDTVYRQLSFFSKNGVIFLLKDNKLSEKQMDVPAIKTFNHIGGHFFVGSSLGLYLYPEKLSHQHTKLSSLWIREIEHNKETGEVWVATNNGVLNYTEQNGSWGIAKTFFSEKQIISIFLDKDTRNLYALSFDGEIYCIYSSSRKTAMIARLREDVQAYKLKYHQHKLYIATNKGLHVYYSRDKKWEVFNKLSGISSDNVQDLCFLNGSIWLATGNGLNKIPVENNPVKKHKAAIHLPHITAGGKITDSFSGIQLRNKEFITLKPEAGMYSSNGNFNYAYRIRNLDTQWTVSPAMAGQIEIRNIPGGKFEIELKATDHLGTDSENKYILSGYSHPPFWKSRWFTVLLILLFLGIVYLIYSLRIRHITQQQSEEIERITLENKLRLSQETAIRAQMNPHFIFNVLNSIKSYFYENDKKNAGIYLQKFAELIRKIMYHSSMPDIKLSEEIELLNIYIQLEALLYPKEFSYNISIDENIDTEFTQIPNFVIQPYIENAFKHGLRHKKGYKQLDISFDKVSDECIKVIITDNGIGRIASNKINQENKNTYPSFSTEAISKRVDLLNKNHQKIDVETIDLKDENHYALGTCVVLTFNSNG